jgi:gamma-glutamyltranspeptidase/glutathione hydrolase
MSRRRITLAVLAVLAALLAIPAALATGRPPAVKAPTAVGTGGAAATVDVLATDAAIQALKDGANAIDAAVVAAAVLGVTEPFSCGVGGGGFMVVRTADGKVTTIDGRETAPAAMNQTSFWENGAPLPFAAARWSGLSAGIPGTVATWAKALEQFGTMSLAEALRPGIKVAKDGFVVDQTFADQISVDFFNDITSTRDLYLDADGTPPDVGSTFRNPDMARTYKLLGSTNGKGMYRGSIAEAMVEAAQNPPVAADANHVWRKGLMTMADLKAYTAPERAPTRVNYRGYDVYSMGPPSSGGSTVGEALNILEGYTLAGASRAQALHLFIEASRFSFADRGAYLGDSDFVNVPLQGLLSDGFAATRRALINPAQATTPGVVAAGDPWPFNSGGSGLAAPLAGVSHGDTTTHLVTSDRWGNVVSYTFTIESTGGNGIVVPGWGFLLNNELTDFDFGLLNHPNSVAGGKRPRSSMSPTIVTKDGKPFLALGSPGGSTIITTALQLLVDRIDLGSSLPAAVAAPRLSQRNTASTQVETSFLTTPEAAALRTTFGHPAFSTTSEIGAAAALEFLPDGRVLAAAEPTRRGGGSAMVENP